MAITTHHGPKPFAWSYSRLKNFETCPKRHYHVDIVKDFKEDESESLKWGNAVHAALAGRIGKGAALPPGMEAYEDWAKKIAPITSEGNIKVLVEQKLAITKDFAPCAFFDRSAWYRGIGDVVKLAGPIALIVDWKTGKILEDSVQLALMAQCVFSHYPDVQRVRSEFIWLKDNATTREDFTRDDMPKLWNLLWPRIKQLEHAHNTTSYPAKPSYLCKKWCPVTSCPHHGK